MTKRCPISYEIIPDEKRYSEKGLRSLSPQLRDLKDFPYTAEQQRMEAITRASRMSIQGVQPKLSALLSVKDESFQVVDTQGKFILKPQNLLFQELPQNEDLTMRLAATIGLEVPLHGLIYCADGSFTYFIQRFDRSGRNDKLSLEDFAQLSEETRDTKYDSSMERVADVVNRFCTFPAIEKVKLFKLTLFSYLVGNEDMHLKNFSLVTRDEKVELSPAYDLLNSTIANPKLEAEMALPIRARKNKLTRDDIVEYYGKTRLKLENKVIDEVEATFVKQVPGWIEAIKNSFLSETMKKDYVDLLKKRTGKILNFTL